ncbi:LysR family transcriptional regulator [Lacticaseibacillus absianus]|uniref:LysR family transcriptional regulator n=1 Tax=Lacticaseibacillus absianus TaxID=2729623 RepID=UPI0015CBA1E1|nr:LysR family transcriptional regulator [Lacticaseibacillus absianus]
MKNLETFKAVYETRSFSRAAALLFIAQPTVSAQIKALEAEFATPLFIRNGRGALGVTPAAEQLYGRATAFLDDWAQLHASLASAAPVRRCRLIASHTFATALLPSLLPRLVAQFPAVQFDVAMANSQAVLRALSAHDADLGFIEKPLTTPGLTRTPLQRDQLVQVGTSGPWLVREPSSGVGYYTRRYLAEQNHQEPQLQVASNAIIVALLHQGFGRAIISQRASAGLATVDLGPRYRRQFFMLARTAAEAEADLSAAVTAWAQADRSDPDLP